MTDDPSPNKIQARETTTRATSPRPQGYNRESGSERERESDLNPLLISIAAEIETMEDEEESTLLFSSQPRSFKMDVRSPQASKLKDAVSGKLMEFLGNYTDDVLAEYIVVLVCNGKHQNQVRDDLEAFLGDSTKRFITWLWKYLCDESYVSVSPSTFSIIDAPITALNSSNVEKEYTNGKTMSGQVQSSNGRCQVLVNNNSGILVLSANSTPSHAINPSEDLQHWNPDSSDLLTELNIKKPRTHAYSVNEKSCVDVNHQDNAIKMNHSCMRSSCEISTGDERDFPQTKPVINKLVQEEHNLLYKHLPTSRILRSVITDDHDSKLLSKVEVGSSPRNLSSKSMNIISSRGSVWDRLGKPREDNEASVVAGGNRQDEEGRVDLTGKEPDECRSVQAISSHVPVRKTLVQKTVFYRGSESFVSNNRSGHIVREAVSITDLINKENNLRRKRDFSDLDHGHNSTSSACRNKDCQGKGASQKLPRSSYINKTIQPHQAPPPTSDFTSTKTRTSTQTSTRRDCANHIAESTVHGPKESDILDMKLKLQQVEMEMLKLRAKQSKMSNGMKSLTVSASSTQGLQNHFEDIESRTIFVSNVHFAASKETLSLHFAKCGEIVNAILLTDPFTGQPKGSAYIVFATKDSAEKALSLGGTSFFSRVLKVMRKTDMPAGGTKSSSQPAGKDMQQSYPPSHKNPNFQRQHSSSHLQWRRDQLGDGETS